MSIPHVTEKAGSKNATNMGAIWKYILNKVPSFAYLIAPLFTYHYQKTLTLIYQVHFEDVPCQSGVNHIMKVRKIMYLDKAYIIVKRNV